MRLLKIVLVAVPLVADAPAGLAAQRHAATDAAIAGSLLTAVPLPVSAAARWADTLRLGPLVRGEVQYSRPGGGDVAGTRTILGVRWDYPSKDSTGWSSGVVGMRVAVARNAAGEARPSAVELHVGGRTLGYLERRGRPDLGMEVVLGLSGFDQPGGDFVVGVRAPAEWVVPAGPGRLLLSFVPTAAWGDIRIQGCVDDGPGDNCGDLGIQLEPGRTRFLLAGGIGYAVHPAGLTVSVGVTRLLAVRQEPRLALGVAWAR